MKCGKMYKSGEVILAFVQFTDYAELKVRPAVVLFEEFGNIVVAGITSNPKMRGIPLSKKEGAARDSVIKTNYIFTISGRMDKKRLFSLSKEKRKKLFNELCKRLKTLKA